MWLIKIKTTKKLYIYIYTLQSIFSMENYLCTLDVFGKVCIKSGPQNEITQDKWKTCLKFSSYCGQKKSTQYEKGKTLIYWPNPESTLVNMHETSIKCSLSGTHSRQHHVTSTRMLFVPTERVLPQLMKTLIFNTEKNHILS